jgi:hypothetical protein
MMVISGQCLTATDGWMKIKMMEVPDAYFVFLLMTHQTPQSSSDKILTANCLMIICGCLLLDGEMHLTSADLSDYLFVWLFCI